MNPILFVRISSSRFRHFHSSILFSFSPSSGTMHGGFVFASAFVLEQVRRRLKSRQPGGRRRSKGFRLVPPTRTASAVAVHPRARAGQIKRTRADNTGHPSASGSESEKGEMLRERGCGRRCAPRRPYRSKATAWKTTPRQRPRPGLDEKAGRLLEKKERGVHPGAVFWYRVQGYEKRPEAGQSTRNSLTQQR